MTNKQYLLKNNLRNIRVKLELTQQIVAKHLGMSDSYYNRIERGMVTPSLITGIRISEALKTLYFEKSGLFPESIAVEKIFFLLDKEKFKELVN